MSYEHLIIPSIPMGLGIGADVFAVTLATCILFPTAFKKQWLKWVLWIGGGHAVLPMIGQIFVIYLGPFLEEWIGLDRIWVETLKTIATVGCVWLLWKFLRGVWDDIFDTTVEVFTILTVVVFWSCTGDALISGGPKASSGLEYAWAFHEVVMSNVIAAVVVIVMCLVAMALGLLAAERYRKGWIQAAAYFVEFSVLGYFMVFFSVIRIEGLLEIALQGNIEWKSEMFSAAIAVTFVTILFILNWEKIINAQNQKMSVATV